MRSTKQEDERWKTWNRKECDVLFEGSKMRIDDDGMQIMRLKRVWWGRPANQMMACGRVWNIFLQAVDSSMPSNFRASKTWIDRTWFRSMEWMAWMDESERFREWFEVWSGTPNGLELGGIKKSDSHSFSEWCKDPKGQLKRVRRKLFGSRQLMNIDEIDRDERTIHNPTDNQIFRHHSLSSPHAHQGEQS